MVGSSDSHSREYEGPVRVPGRDTGVPHKSYDDWYTDKSLKQWGGEIDPDIDSIRDVRVEREIFNRMCREDPEFAFMNAMQFYRERFWYEKGSCCEVQWGDGG